MLDALSMSSLFMAVSKPTIVIAPEGIVMKMVYELTVKNRFLPKWICSAWLIDGIRKKLMFTIK
jgi:hypothetical protein